MMRILVVCTGNSARSQMMEGLLNHWGRSNVQAQSAGTRPGAVNPFAIAVMAEKGIDISRHRSKSVDEFSQEIFDIVITVCDAARESCPVFPGHEVIHHSFDDPAAVAGSDTEKTAVFRRVCGEEEAWVKAFLNDRGLLRP